MIQERTRSSLSWRSRLAHPLFAFLGVVLVISALRQPLLLREQVDLAVPEGAKRMCLSLRTLVDMATDAARKNQPVPPECDTLSGLNYPEGFLLDNRNGPDLVLIGLRWTNRPPLYLDDLVVNIRNIWQGDSYPYCSLDPRKEDVVAWKKIWQDAVDQTNAEAAEIIATLRSNIGPQMVVLGGVPTNSHHAHVMIDADYHMKKVSQGHVKLPGVMSCLDIAVVRDRLLETQGITNMRFESQSRFWFQVREGDLRYAVEKGITWISKCRVVVSTEKQATRPDGELYDVKEDDPDATRFAAGLSQALPRLASLVPDYASLEDLFRLRALLLSVRSRAASSANELGFSDFLHEYRFLHESNMTSSKEGLVNYHEDRSTNETVTGDVMHRRISQRLFTVSGGVSMIMPLKDSSFGEVENRGFNSLTNLVLKAKPSSQALAWTVPSVTGILHSPVWRVLLFLVACLPFFRPIPASGAPISAGTGPLSSIFGFASAYVFPFLMVSFPFLRPVPGWPPNNKPEAASEKQPGSGPAKR